MSATYKITAVQEGEGRVWPSPPEAPKYRYWDIEVDGLGKAGLALKPTDPKPEIGSQVMGNLKDGQNGKPPTIYPAGAGGGRGGGGPRKEDDAQFNFRQRSIAMQNCIGNAVAILKLAAEHGDYKPPSAGDVAGQVETLASKLFALVEGAAKS